MRDILDEVSDHFDVPTNRILSSRRVREWAWPRMIGYWLCRELTPNSFPEIGRFFGRDHSTVIAGCRQVDEWLEEDAPIAEDVHELRDKLFPRLQFIRAKQVRRIPFYGRLDP
jgi:chromosomal replication initiator protein